MMEKKAAALSYLVCLLVLSYGVLGLMGVGFFEDEEDWRRERWEEREEGKDDWFLLQDSRHVVRTEAGEMRVVKSFVSTVLERPMRIGFITMEPKSLFVPQYLDSSLIIFVRRGEAKVGFIYKDALAERKLKSGDVYRIAAGTAFYIVNIGEGQRLQIICSIDPSESLGIGDFQSFFLAGGRYPTSVLAGFDPDTLSYAFNVTHSELRSLLTRQKQGPIIYVTDTEPATVWTKFLQLKEEDRLQNLKTMVDSNFEEVDQNDDEKTAWSWRELLLSPFTRNNKRDANRDDKKRKTTRKSPDSYNLYDRKPDYRNNYGWSVALDESDYTPLKHSGFGVYLVNLTAGSMMAPHVNPTATEYGVVLRGSGRIEIVYPNGTLAMNARVKEGDVFWIPRYFAFCQIASRTGPLEFFGFTTSARKNRPQFLVGSSSILNTMRGPELAEAFGVSEDMLRDFLEAQEEAVILPTAGVAPPFKEREKQEREGKKKREKKEERERRKGEREFDEDGVPKVVKNLEDNAVLAFD